MNFVKTIQSAHAEGCMHSLHPMPMIRLALDQTTGLSC